MSDANSASPWARTVFGPLTAEVTESCLHALSEPTNVPLRSL